MKDHEVLMKGDFILPIVDNLQEILDHQHSPCPSHLLNVIIILLNYIYLYKITVLN